MKILKIFLWFGWFGGYFEILYATDFQGILAQPLQQVQAAAQQVQAAVQQAQAAAQQTIVNVTAAHTINDAMLQIKSNDIIHNAKSLKVNGQSTKFNAVVRYGDKIYVVGQAVIEKEQGKKQGLFLIACYKKDEKAVYILDTTFGSGGATVTEIGNDAEARSVAILSITADTVKIVVGGHSSTDANKKMFTLARYNLDGSLDTTFGDVNKGYVTTIIDSSANAEIEKIVVFKNTQTNTNTIIAGGTVVFDKDKQNGVLVCYSQAGIVNTAWGQNGIANVVIKKNVSSTDDKNAWSACNDVSCFSDKLYVAGKVKIITLTNKEDIVGFVACFNAVNGSIDAKFTHGNPYVDSSLWNSGIVLPSVGASTDETAFTTLYLLNDPTLSKIPVIYASGFDKAVSGQSILLFRLGMDGILLPTDGKSGTSRLASGYITTDVTSTDAVYMNSLLMYSYKDSFQNMKNVLLVVGNDGKNGFLVRYAVDTSTNIWKIDQNLFGLKNKNGINVVAETGMITAKVKDPRYTLNAKGCVVEESDGGSIIVVGTAVSENDTRGVVLFFHKTRGNPLLQVN